ncbi:MAG: transposase [Treponema sp.]|nr:transposase [Treponema sp.]
MKAVNGSGNMKDARGRLVSLGINWTRPKSPEEKPFVERLIGTLQRECLDYHYEPMNAGELREAVDSWLDKCHFYRPHESLNFFNPGGVFRRIRLIHSKNRSVLKILSTDSLRGTENLLSLRQAQERGNQDGRL